MSRRPDVQPTSEHEAVGIFAELTGVANHLRLDTNDFTHQICC